MGVTSAMDPGAGSGRKGAWSIGVSAFGWALGLVGVLAPLGAAEYELVGPFGAFLGGFGMLVANVVSLVLAAVALRRRRAAGRQAAVVGLVVSILGILGALCAFAYGVLVILDWVVGAAAATG